MPQNFDYYNNNGTPYNMPKGNENPYSNTYNERQQVLNMNKEQTQQEMPGQPYYNPAYPFMIPRPAKWAQGCGIASMVIGIVSLLCHFIEYFLFAPITFIGLILGIVSIAKNRKEAGFGITGVILCGISLIISVILLGLFILILYSGNISIFGS